MENLFKNYHFYFKSIATKHLSSANQHWADDIIQDSFIKGFDKLESFDANKGKKITWLTTIVINSCRDFQRKKVNQEVKCDDFSFFDGQSISFEENTFLEIRKYLSLLSKKEQDLIRMRYFFNMSAKEMEPILEVKAKGIPVMHKRALEKLKRILAERGLNNSMAT